MAMADYPYPNSFLMDLPAPKTIYYDEFKKANQVYYGS
jgi:hypothetical protein